MSVIEQDIRSIPAILRQTSARIDERRGVVAPLLDGPMAFLGCGSSYCVAMSESHQTLDYRHGPIASADERTLVWCLDPLDDAPGAAVIDDVRRTGATVQWTGTDPLITVAQAQLFALHKAASRGVDPMAPRHLSRAIIL
jgi:fructoselysine-6-P-deglycase FrlB-like protein